MFSNLYLISYNNYLNRTLKYSESVNEYAENDATVFSNINFNPSDEVTTEQILNVGDYVTFDYLVVESQETGEIVSRWFVIDKTRVRSGQWKLTLRRDVVADYWNVIKSAPCFIEKAMLNYDDYRLFNKEDMTFNQIKTEETLLKDNSGCPWIVFYTDKDFTSSGPITTNNLLDVPFVQLDTTIENWDYYNASNLSNDPTPIESTSGNALIQYSINRRTGSRHYDLVVDTYGNTISGSDNPGTVSGYAATTDDVSAIVQEIKNNMERVGNELIYNNAKSLFNIISDIAFENMIALKGQLLRDTEGKVFRVVNINSKVVPSSFNTFKAVPVGSSIYLNLKNVMSGVAGVTGSATADSFKVTTTLTQYTLELEEQEQLELTYDISGARIKTEDIPYDIFAIPYGTIEVYTLEESGEQTLCRTSAEIAINAATAIQKAGTTAKIYDVQILPYCPVQEMLTATPGDLYLTSALQYSTIKQGDAVKGVIINVPNSRFSFNIQHSIETATNSIERKVNHQCDKWRLASPNYNSYFDFSVEMNNGVQYFNVDCEYKPYSPYIHVNPDFKGLYGQDFNDPRGLVCGGDFSIAQINDQWNQYQIQNKNFQNIFDRQIKNMETVGGVQRTLDIVNAIAGTAQGAVGGASIAALVPGLGATMGAGALIGGGISAAAGIADIALNEKLRNEAINFTKDNFGYQLGNIQALPDVLSRISAFNNNNKLFPVLEYYTCTEVEKEALRNKIKYNGMTVMTIGKIEDYITYDTSYIKGQLIQIPLISDDFHIANTIVGEINKGLYIQGGAING